jgi:hypothetical protein
MSLKMETRKVVKGGNLWMRIETRNAETIEDDYVHIDSCSSFCSARKHGNIRPRDQVRRNLEQEASDLRCGEQ